jgi:hypothetical protein
MGRRRAPLPPPPYNHHHQLTPNTCTYHDDVSLIFGVLHRDGGGVQRGTLHWTKQNRVGESSCDGRA